MSNQSDLPAGAVDRARLKHELNRRRFLGLLGGAGVAGMVGCSAPGQLQTAATNNATANAATGENPPVPSSAAAPESRRPVDATRRLVVIELSGGNDGLATLQPIGSGVLQDQRSGLITPDDELIDAGNGLGWHPALAGMHGLGISAAVGIGSDDPSFSHFEMEQRWWQGVSAKRSRESTGFFGRLCDVLGAGEPVTGLSLAGGATPALASERAVTVGLSDPNASWFFNQDEPWFDMLAATYGSMAKVSPGDSASFSAARGGLSDTLRFAEALAELPPSDDSIYPWTDIGQQMRFAADVLSIDAGVRVLHLRQGGYDTHTGQEWEHRDLMTGLNDATVAFLNDLDRRGQIENTMIMTTSEFGRRVPQNGSGTDHGGASTMIVSTPATRAAAAGAIYGEAPSLTNLDDGNLIATARFEDYYATVAQDWFGIDPTDVLQNGGTPITGLI